MNAKELKDIFRAHQFSLSGKKSVRVSNVMTRLESISDLECDSLEHLNLILEYDT